MRSYNGVVEVRGEEEEEREGVGQGVSKLGVVDIK